MRIRAKIGAMNDKKRHLESSQLIDIIMDIPFFADLDGHELAVVAKRMNYFEITKGETLFNEGDPGDSVCFVVRGSLDIYKQAATLGGQVRISTVSKNQSIGEMAVIDEYTRSATVKARQDTAIVALTKRGFEAILVENPAVGAAILKKIASRVSMNLRRTTSQLADYMNALPIT